MKKFLVNALIILSLSCLSSAVLILPVKALNLKNAFDTTGPLNTVGGGAGFNVAQRSVDPIIGNIITIILSFLGVIFLILMLYGGYMWMTAAGSEEKVKRAQQLIQAAVIGLAVVVGAYAITAFIMARTASTLIAQ
jgi:hypothetical protein